MSAAAFLVLAPVAQRPLPPAAWFIPLFQSVLVTNDLITAALLFGQLRLSRQRASLVLACGYAFAAVMATLHLLTFPGVFAPGGLLGAGAQTTGYMHVFWHLGLPTAVIAYALMKRRRQVLVQPVNRAALRGLGLVLLAAAALTSLATFGNDLLPPMLAGDRYSSAFNIGRHGQWVVIAAAAVVLWRSRVWSALDLWLMVMLCASFFEIALVSVFNAGRYDVGFYAGRVYAVLASSVVLVMLLVEHGKMYRELATAQEARRAEAAMRDSREAVKNILESITDGFFAVDRNWRFTYVNREAERLLRRPREELLGRDVWTEFQVGTAVFRREYERALARQETVNFEEYYQPLGIWLDVRAFPSPTGLSVYFHDVTARKKAEQQLRASEERYRLLADMIPQHIWTTEPDGYHTYFSRRWYEYTGADVERTQGEGWLELLHPGDREHTLAAWHHSLRTGEPYSVEYRFRGADGIYRWFLGQATPLRDEAGAITEWFGTLTDISERKRLECERERLLESEREAREEADRRRAELESVSESRSRLMRGFSHDLRNPLAAADGSALLLEDGRAFGALTDRQLESVRRIRRGIRTSLRLIDDLLELARAEAGQIELRRVEVDVGEAVREIADDFQAQATAAGLAIEVRVPDGIRVLADPVRVRQILANLVSNAVKYAPRGRVTLEARTRSTEGPVPGVWIPVKVSDTGPGIPEDKRELIFQEYTRLDPGAQHGAGIGLAISRRMARLMGGDLTASSEPGCGSTFTLWLRASPEWRPAAVVGARPRSTVRA